MNMQIPYVKVYLLVLSFLVAMAARAQGENLLQNPGFEGDGHWVAEGSASLQNQWRSHEGGQFNAAILGMWATQGDEGYILHEHVVVVPDTRYQLSAWLWADLGWMPGEQYMSIAFYSDGGELLDQVKAVIPEIHPYWTPMKCLAVSPSNAVSARICIGARNISHHGALTIDDVSFNVVPPEPELSE